MKQVRLPLLSPEVLVLKEKYGRPKKDNQKRKGENPGEVVGMLQKKQRRPCDVSVLNSICVMQFEEKNVSCISLIVRLLFRDSQL